MGHFGDGSFSSSPLTVYAGMLMRASKTEIGSTLLDIVSWAGIHTRNENKLQPVLSQSSFTQSPTMFLK